MSPREGAGARGLASRITLVAAFAGALACGGPDRGDGYTRALAEARRAHHAGRFDEAARRFDDAAARAKIPRDAAYARYEAAMTRARAGDQAGAAATLRAIAAEEPPGPYAATAAFKAAMLAYASEPERGVRDLEAIAIRYPESGVGQVALQRVLRHDDEEGGADAALARAASIAARTRGSRVEEIATYERAKRLAELDRTVEARDAFLDVAARWPYPMGPMNDDALFRAAELEEKLGRPREAIATLERLLSQRESSDTIGSYERPRYVPAMLRIAEIHERLGDTKAAREALHRLYRDFRTSTLRDDALWREAELWRRDGDASTSCARLSTLAREFPNSRYVPCAIGLCSGVTRPEHSKAPTTCRDYITRGSRATDD